MEKTIRQNYFYRMHLWLTERFPYFNFVSGAVIYFLARSIVSLPGGLHFRGEDFWGALVPATHLFLLRVFDEYKDFESDLKHYPDRILQRGIFTLRDVAAAGAFAFVLQLSAFLCLRPSAVSFALYAALWAWTLLMFKEFFCGWLDQEEALSICLVAPDGYANSFALVAERFGARP